MSWHKLLHADTYHIIIKYSPQFSIQAYPRWELIRYANLPGSRRRTRKAHRKSGFLSLSNIFLSNVFIFLFKKSSNSVGSNNLDKLNLIGRGGCGIFTCTHVTLFKYRVIFVHDRYNFSASLCCFLYINDYNGCATKIHDAATIEMLKTDGCNLVW